MKVLIVEDNLTSALLLMTLVEQLDGFTAMCAASAGEALSACRGETFDLILMDYLLPDGNGLDLARTIRALPGHRECAVVMITSSYEKNLRLACLEGGVDEFLNKPVDVAELRLRLVNLAAVARLRRAVGSGISQLMEPLESSLSLPEGALAPIRRAVSEALATGSAAFRAEGPQRRLAEEFVQFAASLERMEASRTADAPARSSEREEDLTAVELPRVAAL